MAKEKICPDCGHHMIRTWTSKDKTHIRIKCPTCELGIEIEPKEEHRWQELLEEAKKQWIKVKSKEVEKEEHRWQELLEEAKKQWIKVKSKDIEPIELLTVQDLFVLFPHFL
ncbi:unnamed protein product [marine sediment metagenome]|uniref:Uncharacterized protein n=1 Tax=marine sediment metagenome TaxID=412755 RepID=X1TPF7_9ZZZZ